MNYYSIDTYIFCKFKDIIWKVTPKMDVMHIKDKNKSGCHGRRKEEDKRIDYSPLVDNNFFFFLLTVNRTLRGRKKVIKGCCGQSDARKS